MTSIEFDAETLKRLEGAATVGRPSHTPAAAASAPRQGGVLQMLL